MKRLYNSLFFIAALLIGLASCKKDGNLPTAQTGSFANTGELIITPSTQVITLTAANADYDALTINWPAANFGDQLIVNYTVQFDIPSDTTGGNAWSKAKNYNAGTNVLAFSISTKDLNAALGELGLAPGTAANILVRVKSDVAQYNGSASTIPSSYSKFLKLSATTYSTSLFIPGGYQGWDPSSAPALNPADGKPGLYEAYINITGNGIQYYKYTNAPDWNHTNYGDGGNGKFSTDGAAGGLNVSDGGYYEVTANMNTNSWTATKTTWGIIGDASPGGWSTDTQMFYDAVKQVWKATVNMKAAGSFKFRANSDWKIDFGIDGNGNLVYADNPFFGFTSGLNNLTVPTDGNYTFTLDLHISGKYLYSIVKN